MFFEKETVSYEVAVPPLIIKGIYDSIVEIGENKTGENQSSGEKIDVNNSSESDDDSLSDSSNDEKQSTNEYSHMVKHSIWQRLSSREKFRQLC
jgi:hypothetical protein